MTNDKNRQLLIVYGILRPAVRPLPVSPDVAFIESSVSFSGKMTHNGHFPKVDIFEKGTCIGDLLSIDTKSNLFKSWFDMEHQAGYKIAMVKWQKEDFMGTGKIHSGEAWVFHNQDSERYELKSGNWLDVAKTQVEAS